MAHESSVFEPLKSHRRSVILDTDIGPDVDDVGAVAVMYTLAKRYGIDVLGVINCTSNPYGSGALDALNQFCGFPDVPIGQCDRPDFLGESIFYNKFLSEHFSKRFTDGTLQVHGAVGLYRRLLADAPDDSVILVTIGPLTTVADLYESGPDAYAPLSGRELVAKKVHALVSVAAEFPEGLDWNVKMEVSASRTAFEPSPVPVFYAGHEFGKRFKTGFHGYTPANWQSNPIYHAYNLYINGRWPEKPRENNCWDLLAVQFAFEGAGRFYEISPAGQVHFQDSGYSTFEVREDGTQRYIRNACTLEELAEELNACMRWG